MEYVIQLSDMWHIWYLVRYSITILLSWLYILYLLDAHLVRIMYVCILYTSLSRIRYTRTPAGVCGLLLSCRRAALIRNERVERAFARVDKGTTAAVAFDIDQRRQ